MGGLGLLQGAQAEKDQKKHNLAAAESTRYSSWTGKNPMQQRFGGQTALGSGLQGAVGGLAMAQQFSGGAGASNGATSGGYSPSAVSGDSGQGMMLSGGPGGKPPGYWRGLLNSSFVSPDGY